MSYVVIARKYRPQNFNEVIGQEHVTRTLKNAIKLKKISHAYLFTGPRGVGKTTTARLLAKAVNCKQKKAEDPCNKCDICEEITKSMSVDVIEIDAASNRGIDEIRKLRENIKFTPSKGKYKVYIIDEVHMLTKEAFNAILKTLEEPPEHAIFIMATTESEKVLDTITSRCQKFDFKLISESLIKKTLEEIAAKEKIECEEEGLWMIARAGKGSMRDAQSIMDQVISYSGGKKIVAKDIGEILGLIPRDMLFSYTEFIKNQDVKSALELTNKLTRDGYNLNRLFNDILEHFRNLMFAKVFGSATGVLGLGTEYSQRLASASKDLSKEQLVWIIEFLTRNLSRMRYSESPQIIMDTIIFKLCQKYVSFDDILKTVEKGESIPQSLNESVQETIVETTVEKKIKKPSAKSGSRWNRVLDLLKAESQVLYHSLKESKATLKGKCVNIVYSGNLELTERHITILKEKIIELMGEGYYPEIIKKTDNSKVIEENKRENESINKKDFINPAKIEEEEPVVGEIVNLFKGRIEKE